RTYANGNQAVALLTTGLIAAAGIVFGWMWTEDAQGRLIWVFGTLILLGAAALVLGVVFPNQRFTPPMRRAVEIFEAACIAAVLPLALAVMDLYSTLRHLDIGCWNKPTAPRLPGGSRAFGSDDATTLGTGAGCGKRRCRTDTPAA